MKIDAYLRSTIEHGHDQQQIQLQMQLQLQLQSQHTRNQTMLQTTTLDPVTLPGLIALASTAPSPHQNHLLVKKGAKTRHIAICIDDSANILQSINNCLEQSNCSVLMINDAVKGLMQIVRHQPDLILLDAGMPRLDGYKFCVLLRRHPNFKQTPIILVTGSKGLTDLAKVKVVGASGFLVKPFTQAELLLTVFQHLK